ncbi:hypothetical protein [Candidatus Hodarchaeum mangrovi]
MLIDFSDTFKKNAHKYKSSTMAIIEEPRTFLYYQNDFPNREPLILFGGCRFQNTDDTTSEVVYDLKKLFQSLLDSIEQAYTIHFNISEVIRGISGELNIELSNLQQRHLENAQDYHAHFGKNRLLRLQMMKQLDRLGQRNLVCFTSNKHPPFQLFFLHWLETILNEFFIVDLLNSLALNMILRLGLNAQAHALLKELSAEISIFIRDTQFRYVI